MPSIRSAAKLAATTERNAQTSTPAFAIAATHPYAGLLAAVLICIIYHYLAHWQVSAQARTSPFLDDEGTGWILTHLAMHGYVQYVSFVHEYMPFTFYLLGLVSSVWGGDLPAARMAVNCFSFFISPLVVYAIGRTLLRSTAWGLIALALYLLMGCLSLVKGFAFLVFLWALVSERDDKSYTRALTGAALAFCLLTAQEFGVYAACTLFAVSLLELVDALPNWRSIIALQKLRCIGFAIVVLPPLLFYLITGSLGTLFFYAFYKGFIATPGSYNLPYPWSIDLHAPQNWKYYLFPIIPVLGARVALCEPPTDRRKMFALVIAFCTAFITALGRADPVHIAMGLLVAPILVAVILWRCFDPAVSQSDPSLPRTVTITCALFFAAQLWILRHSEAYYRFQAPLAVAATAVTALWIARERLHRRYRAVAHPHLVGLALIISIVFFEHDRLVAWAARAEDIIQHRTPWIEAFMLPPAAPDSVVGVQLAPAQLQEHIELKHTVDDLSGPNEPIVLFPQHSYLFAYLKRPNATRLYQYLPSITSGEVKRLISALSSKPPKVVIYDPLLASSLGTDLNMFFLRHYSAVRQLPSLQVLVPQDNDVVELSDNVGGFVPDTNVHEYVYADYRKPVALRDADGHEHLTLFQHPPYATRVTLTSDIAFQYVTDLEFLITPSPAYPGVAGESRAILKTTKGYRTIVSQQFEPEGKRSIRVNYPVPPDLTITGLTLESTMPHGTHWRVWAYYQRPGATRTAARDSSPPNIYGHRPPVLEPDGNCADLAVSASRL